MKLTHLIGTNFFGGPERQILTHALRIRDMGFEPQIVSFHENGRVNGLLEKAKSLGLACRELKPRSPFNPVSVLDLSRELRDFRTKILVGHGYKANVVGRLASWSRGIPFMVVSRGWTAESPKIRFYEALDRSFLRFADAVVAVSEGQRQKILACGGRPDKVRVIHNAIDLTTYPDPAEKSVRLELGIPQDAILVATAGRLSPEKNHRGMIEAARLVLAKMPDVYFVVFGEGFLRPELEKAVVDAGIGDRFFLPGFRSDVRSLLYEIDVFTLPSQTEGLPNVVLEAFACRKPVVATRVGGTPEVVRHGENGFLVKPNGMEELAACLTTLCASPGMRQKMGQKGYLLVRDQFGYEQQTRLYLNIYEVLDNK
jgi:glycosyltransferase involved in cell wall biosynthesis